MTDQPWKPIARIVRDLCVRKFGEDLLDALAGLNTPDRAAVEQTTRAWLERCIFPALQTPGAFAPKEKHSVAANDEENEEFPASGAHAGPGLRGEVLSLFGHEYEKAGLSRRLASSVEDLRRAWRWQEPVARERAIGILRKIMREFINEARFDGSQRHANWQRIDQGIKALRQEIEQRAEQQNWSSRERAYALRRLEQDRSWLAAELLLYFERPRCAPSQAKPLGQYRTGGKPDDVTTVQGLLGYFYEFMPEYTLSTLHEDGSEIAELANHVPLLNWEWESFAECLHCLDCPTVLSQEERQVVEAMLNNEASHGLTKGQLAEQVGLKRGTFNNRLDSATRKILACLAS